LVARQIRRQAASKACAAVAEVKKSRVVDADEVDQFNKQTAVQCFLMRESLGTPLVTALSLQLLNRV
jgi:hypothetical protein